MISNRKIKKVLEYEGDLFMKERKKNMEKNHLKLKWEQKQLENC